jgi:hypothetical protein
MLSASTHAVGGASCDSEGVTFGLVFLLSLLCFVSNVFFGAGRDVDLLDWQPMIERDATQRAIRRVTARAEVQWLEPRRAQDIQSQTDII